MKSITIISLLFIIASAAEFYEFPEETYTPESLLNDEVELKKRLDCLLDKQPCTPLHEKYKSVAADGLATACVKCKPELKALVYAGLRVVKEKYPEDYEEFILKYDPTRVHINAFEKSLES